jgi:membrane-associated phospholipid phosphatase
MVASIRRSLVLLGTLALIPGVAFANEVTKWNRVALETSAAAQSDPLTESRILAIVQAAVHDAVNAVTPRYKTYLPARTTDRGASPDAAVASAAHATLAALLPASRAQLDVALADSLNALADDSARSRGVALGRDVAMAVLAHRQDDGAARQGVYDAGTKPGEYRPTPPDFTPAFMPQWGKIRPFVLACPSQFRPVPPPTIGSEAYARDLEEVRAIGGETSMTRTPEQSQIAKYWYESSVQGWNRIAREIAIDRQLDAWDAARLYALVNVAMADGFIAGFDAKYHYNFWRPITAIRVLEPGDGHPADEPGWSSFLVTPPVPDYPSTHTVLGAAAAAVMRELLGTDFVSFTMTSGAPYGGITRRFWSLSEAARENGASRVFAGIHFSTAVTAGYELGDRVGVWVFEHAFAPLPSTPVEPTLATGEARLR